MSISIRRPKTNISRQKALNKARDKNTATPGNDVLKVSTANALTVNAPIYNTAMQNSANTKALYNTKTAVKDIAVIECRHYNSHFIQVFNFGVVRGKYPAGHRSFYHLETDSDALPNMDSEDNVQLWGHYIVDGDAARLLAGGVAMANPDAAEVNTALGTMETLLMEHSNLADDLDAKQELIDDLNEDVIDDLIKKIWDEVESTYGSETPESKRANCRHWGVVYATDGIPATLSGLVKNSDGTPAAGANIEIEETGAETITNSEGRYTIDTVILGDVTIVASYPAGSRIEQTVNIPDHTDGININVPDMMFS